MRTKRNIRTKMVTAGAVLLMGTALAACGDDPGSDDGPGPAAHETVRSELERDTSPVVSDEAMDTLIAGNHSFTIELYDELAANADGNMMISPVSIRMAFGLLYAGARNETETEIAETLDYGLEQDELHSAFNALDLALTDRNVPADDEHEPVELYIANAFWGQTGYPWRAEYLDTIAVNYGAGVEALDFDLDPEGAREVINTWVEDRTRDRIQDLLPEGSIDPSTVAVLTNAVYFKAPWALPFMDELTSPGDFTNLAGQTVSAEFMTQSEVFAYGAGDGYEAVEMNFRNDELGMVFIVPDAGTFEDFEGNLTSEALDTALGGLEPAQGIVQIPKFEFESGFELSEVLQAMGMTTAFASADLSGMIENDSLFISGVFHKTFIAIDEDGAEAAAATAIVVGETSVPIDEFELTADRPFLFLIRDRITGAILFYGRVVDPTA